MKRLTYDFEIGGNHCWEVKGADNLECREVCERQGDNGCKTCPISKAFDRLAAIEDILGDEYDLNRLRELAEADRMIGKEVWAQAKYLNVFQTKSSFIQRKTIQYVSLLKGKDILCHTQTCAFPLNEIGKTIFLTYEEAMAALRREQE